MILNEISQTEEDKYCTISFIRGIKKKPQKTNRKNKLIEIICTEEQISGWGRDETEEMEEMGNLFGGF